MRLQVDGRDFMVYGMNWTYIPIGENYAYDFWGQPDDFIKAALAVEMPLLRTRWLDFELPLDKRLGDYDWIAFTSARALEAIVQHSKANRWSWPPVIRAAAVGDRTAHELQARGWMPACPSIPRWWSRRTAPVSKSSWAPSLLPKATMDAR